MNAVTEIINHFANLWADQMWTIIWQSSVFALLVLMVSLLLRRMSSAAKFWLWMLVPLRLLVMPLITISLPLLPAVTQREIQVVQTEPVAAEIISTELPEAAYETTLFSPEVSLPTREPVVSVPVERHEVAVPLIRPNVPALLMTAWLAGVLFWAARLIYSWRKIRRIVGSATRLDKEPVLALAQKASAMVGLKHIPSILVTEEGITPFLFGVFRPVLVVPAGFVRNVSKDGLLAVFSHEFAHLKRKDTLIGWILAVCEAIYFFHPIFHFVKKRILFERERACDDCVIAAGDHRKRTYADALINAADICRDFSAKLAPVGAVAESFGDLKKRIVAIGSNLTPTTKLSKTAFVLLIVIGIVCVPGFILTNRTNAELAEEVGEIVQGVVKNRDGKPIPNAQILLYHNISNWDFENRIEQTTTITTDGLFQFDEPLKYNDISEYPYGQDSYILVATHPDYALGWYNIEKGAEKDSYELTLTEPIAETVTVTDHDGNPLSGVRVWPYGLGAPSGPEPLFRDSLSIQTDAGISGAVTGSDGKAVITNLPQTRISYHATLEGYATGLAFPSRRTIRLNKGATVSGAVLDENGEAVENALVKFHTNWNYWQFFLTRTNSQGRFIFEDLPADGWDMSPWGPNVQQADGSYIITIEHDDYISPETQDQFMPGEVKENFIIDAYHGTLVKCNVVETGTNNTVAGARIQGSNESGRIDGRSDADGVFSFRVMPGQVSIFFSSTPEGVYVLRDDGSSRSSISFEAQGQEMTVTLEAPKIAGPVTTVRGKVVLPDGSPAADVGIYTTNSSAYESFGWSGAGGAYTGTNPDGTFELENVPAGLKLFLYGNTKDFQYILAETIDDVSDPTELPEPLIMKEGQVADVLFTDEQDKPRANMSLKITPMMWGNHIPRADEHFGQTDEEGRLVINGIIPGMEYFIIDSRGSRSESGWWDTYFNDTKVLLPESGEKVEIRAAVSAVEVMKEEISGFVVDEDGNSINGASVTLLNRELVLLPNPVTISGRTVRAITDGYYGRTGSDGYFRIAELNPGLTDIIIRADNYKTKMLEDISTGTREMKIVLSESSSYKLSGEVVDGDGNPISDVQITLAQDQGQIITSTTQTDTSGGFQFDDILEPTIERNARLLIARKEGFGVWGKILDTTGYETSVKISLLPEKTVSGRVVDDAGNPIAGAEVRIWAYTTGLGSLGLGSSVSFSNWQDIAPTVMADTEGQFVLTSLPANKFINIRANAEGYCKSSIQGFGTGQYESQYDIYTIRRSDGGLIRYDSGSDQTDEEIEIVLQKGAILRGTVTYEDTGLPVQGLRVATQSHKESLSASAVTNQAGQFELENVNPSPCNLMVDFENSDYSLPEWTAAALELYELEPGGVIDDIKLVFVKGGIIRGKVTDSAGNPLRGIDIAFYSAARPRSSAACQVTLTAEDGTWANRFPPGEVYAYIRTFPQGTSWSRRAYNLNISAGQEITDIDFTLRQELDDNSPYR